MKRRRRKEMMSRPREFKSRDPKRYWNRVQRLMGKVSKGMPKELVYKGVSVQEDKEMEAWTDMFLEQEGIPIDPQEEKWVNMAIEMAWRKSDWYWDPILDGDLEDNEIREAIVGAPGGKAVGVDAIPMDLVKVGGEGIKQALAKVFKQAWRGTSTRRLEERNSVTYSKRWRQ